MIRAWSSPRRAPASLPYLLVLMLCIAATTACAQGGTALNGSRIAAGAAHGAVLQAIDSSTIEPGRKLFLEPNYPNPFAVRTVVAYTLGEESRVTLRVYDYFYRVVAVLVDDELQGPGRHDYQFIPVGLPSGMYLYDLRTSKGNETRRMLYIK